MLREAAGILDGLGDLPLVCEHRDFSPWNVMVGSTGELGALDWEGAEPHGLPLIDLLYFLACLAFHAERSFEPERQHASYRASLDESTPTGRVRRECLMRYCDRTGLDLEELLPLRQLVWLIHAAGAPGSDVLRRSLFKSLWEEEVHWMARGGGRRAGERGESSAVA
jgi:aminoglycoside phosphotransferase (APT) family kinase protein